MPFPVRIMLIQNDLCKPIRNAHCVATGGFGIGSWHFWTVPVAVGTVGFLELAPLSISNVLF